MDMAGDNLKDYVYYPSEETIFSYLRRLKSDGREGANLPSAIKWRQVYTSEVIEAPDFKESWMEDFPVGASGERHAKWYATDLKYNSKGKGIRSTPRGGHWNLRATRLFDYNRKLLSPSEIDTNDCKIAFHKKNLQYRKGKKVTPWKMIEFTIREVRAQYAICQIFPVQPIEPSQDDVPRSHAAIVPSSGPHLQEAQCTAAQDETTRRYLDNAWNIAGLSPMQIINFPGYIEETCGGTTSGAFCGDGQSQPSSMNILDFSSYIPSQQTPFGTPANSSEGHQLQRRASDLGLYASSSYPSQDMNHQGAWNVGNFPSGMDDYFPPQDPTLHWGPLISGHSHSPPEPRFQTGEKGGSSEDPKEWPEQNENAFLQILYKRVQKNSNRTSSFNEIDWQEIDDELFEATRVRYGREKIKEKYNYLRTKYYQFLKELEHVGAPCDLNSNTGPAAQDTPQIFFQKYEMLSQVFNYASMQLPFASNEEDKNEEEFPNRGVHVPQGEQSCVGSSKEKYSADEHITNVKKKSKLEILASTNSATIEKDLAQAKKHKGECSKATSTQSDPYSIEECMDVLEMIKDISDASYNKALEKFKDLDWRKMFIKMSIIRRESWLKSLA